MKNMAQRNSVLDESFIPMCGRMLIDHLNPQIDSFFIMITDFLSVDLSKTFLTYPHTKGSYRVDI